MTAMFFHQCLCVVDSADQLNAEGNDEKVFDAIVFQFAPSS